MKREILVEIEEKDLKEYEAIAEVEGRSRRRQIGIALSEWLQRRRKP